MTHINRRRGVLIVAVMVCLFVVLGIAGSTVQALVREHRQSRTTMRRAQTEMLARSALDRASARLRQDSSYMGETWHVVDGQLADGGASITIVVEPGDQPNQRLISVEATYPKQSATPVLIQRHESVSVVDSGDQA
ncbi:MAG: hypothetical protein KDA38_00715 [Planctomycetales bacterium]|nr:hypothetical protein [Planctomycetales bacterium]